MAARMISLLRFKGRRMATLLLRGTACLMLIVICSLFCDGLGCVAGRPPHLSGCYLAPDGLNSRTPMLACPPYRSETFATIRVCWFPTRQPITPRTSGDGPHMAAPPAPCNHETEDAMSVRWKRQGGAPQLTRDDPSRTTREAEHSSGEPFSIRPFKLNG